MLRDTSMTVCVYVEKVACCAHFDDDDDDDDIRGVQCAYTYSHFFFLCCFSFHLFSSFF